MVSEQKKGWAYFAVFGILILAGIAVKRIWHHPEMIMFFHLPAAVFLAMAGRSIPVKLRQRYREQVRSMDVERL
ncbi:MAG TPA: hypothetical protein VFX30_11980 [bacterium]|nr:hypothetical protein [bacterium]